jgi:beta-galactosidase
MAGSSFLRTIRRAGGVLVVALALAAPLAAYAQADRVTTVKDEKGWKLQVNGEDFYVKGMVWGYTPRGQNYTYNLWGESDDFIREGARLRLRPDEGCRHQRHPQLQHDSAEVG